MNGGYFEHKFCSSDFLMCFIRFIDIGLRKFVRCRGVQKANNVSEILHGTIATE